MNPNPPTRPPSGCGPLWFWALLFVLACVFIWLLSGQGAGASQVQRPYRSYDGETVADVRADRAAMPCWSNSRRPHPSCTPTPFPPAPTDTAVPTYTPTPTNTAIAPPTGTAAPTGTPVAQGTNTPNPSYQNPPPHVLAFEAEVERLVNQHRLEHIGPGAPQWVHHDALSRAERWWAIEMVARDACYHGDYGMRAMLEGFPGFPWGEDGACGYVDPLDTLQGWLDSPGHHAILDECCNMTHMGVGAHQYANGRWSAWLLIGQWNP